MPRVLAAALVWVLFGAGCVPSRGEARPAPEHQAVRGEIVDFEFAVGPEVALWLDTGEETIRILVDGSTVVRAAGRPVEAASLPSYQGLSATVVCRRTREWCLDTRLVEVELATEVAGHPGAEPRSKEGAR